MRPRQSIASGAGLVLAIGLASACSSSNGGPASQPAPPPEPALAAPQVAPADPPSVDATTTLAADLPPLPPGISAAARPPEVVRAVYQFAARHPEVLHYVPCFCGCERMGHQGSDDCFVSARDGAGHVAAWESHGMVCEVCLDVARDAMQMHNSGASTWAIRNAIEQKYASPNRSHTPTPQPPRGGRSAR